MKTFRTAFCGCALGVIAAACSGEAENQRIEYAMMNDDLRLVGETGLAPDGCDSVAVIDHLRSFFEALNERETRVAESYFTDGDAVLFQWFTFTDWDTGGPGHFETFAPGSLNAYFATRHAAGDRLVLRGAKFIGYEPERGTVSFSPVLFHYHVIDPKTNAPMIHYGIGKGSYHCQTGRFQGMSLGASARDAQWAVLWSLLGANGGS